MKQNYQIGENEMTWMNIENLDQYEVLNWIEHIWIGVNLNNTYNHMTCITSIAWKKKDRWQFTLLTKLTIWMMKNISWMISIRGFFKLLKIDDLNNQYV
jgi:hypothetical protein